MKKVYCLILVISLLTAPYGYARMGGGKSGGGMMGGQQGGMMGGQGSQGNMGGMMQGHEVTSGMMHHMGQMSRLMQQMRDIMAEQSDAGSMRNMSGLMQDMSEHLMDMSIVMKKGKASQKEIQELDQHNIMMQKRYDKMRW
jgi:hypothetical protein